MQAVVALCHFCEKHGPRIVVTCQPLRSLPSPIFSPVPCGYDRSSEGVNIYPSTSTEVPPLYYGDCTRTYIDTDARCGACTSLGPLQCLLSNDHQNKTSYITTQVSLKDEVHKRLSKACTRSLTCEIAVPPKETTDHRTAAIRIGSGNDALPDLEKIKEEEGPVSFGDAEMGMCIAYRFRIHDSKARGRKRLFSLVILTQDVSSLSVHHDFFLEALKSMKDLLQTRAYNIFQKETEKEASTKVHSVHQHPGVAMSHFEKMMREKVEIDPTRTLQVLTASPDIFAELHRCMMWTLRTQTMRFKDQLLEGDPTQDMLVLMEMDKSHIVELDLDQPNQAELTLQQLRNLRCIAKQLKEQNELDTLVVHVITGGQIIVQSSEQLLAKQFLLAISNLLPIGCLRINNYADRYYEPSEYNMLGCVENFPIQGNVLRVVINSNSGETSMERCTFTVTDRPHLPEKFPRVAARYNMLLLDDGITIGTLKATINSTREEWLNKAKLLYQLEQQALRDPLFRPKGDLLLYVTPGSDNERTMLKFWQNGLAASSRLKVVQEIVDFIERRKNKT